MRIVIDLQGAQSTGSRNRGIGRYSLALTEALIRQRRSHEVILVLNGAFANTIASLRAQFSQLLPKANIRVWEGTPGSAEIGPDANPWKRAANELLREAFISSLRPDVVLVTSLFEGLIDDAVTSIGLLDQAVPTAVVLYDLIPLVNRKPYLENPAAEAWYERKLASARRAKMLLAISDSSRQEALRYLGTHPGACVSISTAADPRFKPIEIDEVRRKDLLARLGLTRSIVMYTGGIDHRKNIEGLIRAYGLLSSHLRVDHQLAIVCAIQSADRNRLSRVVAASGLNADEVVFTGFVSESDLIALYNLCKLFVFPSWHEGFGLPALEAMSCGRAVVAANTSSLPEVIGRADALFDPYSETDMARSMSQALNDPSWLKELERHGLERAQLFSWNATAEKALAALERMHVEALARSASSHHAAAQPAKKRPRLAVVAPLLPERSGISNYNSELLPELARHYDIEIVSPLAATTDPWVRANGPLRSPDWLVENAKDFERVLYHFGNSHFHQHMFELLAKVSGVVVLHDFYLSDLAEYMHAVGARAGDRAVSFHQNHGYLAAIKSFALDRADEVTREYPCNLAVLQQARGVIVHSQASCSLARQWYGDHAADEWAVIPLLRALPNQKSKAAARRALQLSDTDFVVCSFGLLGRPKLNDVLVKAWRASALAGQPGCQLLFVGENDAGPYGAEIERALRELPGPAYASITGWVDDERYRLYLAAADLAVQLRTRSRGETSAAVLDCLNCGVATIVNAHGSLSELPDGAVWKMADKFEAPELTRALETLWRDGGARADLSERGCAEMLERHAPRDCANLYAEAIERFHNSQRIDGAQLATAVAQLNGPSPYLGDWLAYASTASWSLAPSPSHAQLLVDVSELVRVDARTGIQRVVRSILKKWLVHPPQGFRVEPVYAADDGSYRYARQFTFGFLGGPSPGVADPVMEARVGDQFILLDLYPRLQPAHLELHRRLQRLGVPVRFVVYDLLPVQMPQHFPDEVAVAHHAWLKAVAVSDGAICISRTVADELFDWLQFFGPQGEQIFEIDWFHLGADLEASKPSVGLSEKAQSTIEALARGTALLVVGTVEPRKRHDQVLDAFEQLWKKGSELQLVIVGKQGWNTAEIAHRLRTHPQLERRLFWFEHASDELLEKVYGACKGLISASEGEGFGLNLIEAARAGLPILARDIPVFREVAGQQATYFSAPDAHGLAIAVQAWATSLIAGNARSSQGLACLSWAQSAANLLTCLLAGKPYRLWRFDGSQRFLGSDPRLQSQVGVRRGRSLESTATAGYLMFGPFLQLPRGRYRVSLTGLADRQGLQGAHADVTVKGGTVVLAVYPAAQWRPETGSLLFEEFELARECGDLEIRVWVPASAHLAIHQLEVAPAPMEGHAHQDRQLGVLSH